ncbi:MAG: DUF362 domain-containing protein [Candidatus Glassbacteria bacterium]|nr:DUF362 domain-containing protein [Candidatus Glassbacteria bacterium]
MNARKNIGRRDFIRTSAAALAAASLTGRGELRAAAESKSRVVRVHSSEATRPWDYSANAPWDHTVEPRDGKPGKIAERYFDYINDEVVDSMLERGLRELTGSGTATEALRKLMPGVAPGRKITIKLNLNNATYDPEITNNRMDQTMPLVNSVIGLLHDGLGIEQENLTILDASRWAHPVIMKGRCRFPQVNWIDSTVPVPDRWDKSETVTFTRDEPLPGGAFWMPKAYTGADHIINMFLMKNHGCGITGAMKNHFGSIPSPKKLHEGLGDKSYIADLCNTPSIRDKVRLNLADALFANWHNNVWCPRPWNTFPEQSPNSLLMAADPVAIDSVMLDHIAEEIDTQGDNAPAWVRDCLNHHYFLEYAMTEHGLGVFERKPYKRIEYKVVEI